MRQKDTASRRAPQKQNQMFLSLKNIKKKTKKTFARHSQTHAFSILSAVLAQNACQLIFTKCLSLLHLNRFRNCTCFMKPMWASDSWYLRKNKLRFLKKKILAINIRLKSRRAELRLAVRVQDTSKAHMGSQLLWGSVPHQQGLKCNKAPSSNLEGPGDTDTGQTARL